MSERPKFKVGDYIFKEEFDLYWEVVDILEVQKMYALSNRVKERNYLSITYVDRKYIKLPEDQTYRALAHFVTKTIRASL